VCIEIYALPASAMEPVTSARGSLGKDFWEDYKEAKIDLTYSTTGDISRVKYTRGAARVHNSGKTKVSPCCYT
jgi:hypothetical protein